MGGRVACLGLLVADTVAMPIDALPQKGTLELVERIELHTGGCAANTAVALANLGLPVSALGKVGKDGFGQFVTSSLQAAGVDTAGVVATEERATAATVVTVHSDAERSFLHVIGANAVFRAEDVVWEAARNASILHIAGLQLMPALEGAGVAEVLKEAKRRGLLTTLDTVMNPKSAGWSGLAPALPYLDWAMPSFDEAALLTGERGPEAQAAKLKAGGAKNVAIKQSKDGCYIAPENAPAFHAPALPVVAIDTLGAGDAWAAGFLAGLLHGWPLQKTARFANAVGASCVTALGATTGVQSVEQTVSRFGL